MDEKKIVICPKCGKELYENEKCIKCEIKKKEKTNKVLKNVGMVAGAVITVGITLISLFGNKKDT